MLKPCLILGLALLSFQSTFADVLKSGSDHFSLKQEAVSELSPEDVWKKLITPSLWWHHSYSGNVQNMTLDLKVDGIWKEEWAEGSVVHGRILYIKNDEQLRLDAPFGPLQAMAIRDIWTITIAPHAEGGSIVTFEEIAIGSSDSGLDKLAEVVDQVKTEALMRLVAKDVLANETILDESESAETQDQDIQPSESSEIVAED